MQSQVGEALILLEALIQSAEDWGDGSMAEPECGCGEHVGDRGVHRWIISPVGTNVMFEGLWANDFWSIVS